MKITFSFWVKYLKFISILFAAMGLMWMIVGSFDPFGMYDTAFAQSFWNRDTLPQDAQTAFRFILGPFGATMAGYFTLQYFIAKHAYAKKEIWGYNAILIAFFIWFITDTLFCINQGAFFNILFANIPCLIATLPIVFTRHYFKASE